MRNERRWNRRVALVGPLAMAGALILGTGATAAHTEEGATPQAATDHPSIAVIGNGEASAPAEGAVIQIVVRRNVSGVASVSEPSVNAFAGGPEGFGEPLTEAEVQPVVEVLVAGGIPAETIEIVIAPSAPFTGAFGPGTAQILTEVDETLVGTLGEVLPAAVDAALAANLGVDQLGVGYTVADCAAVETAALRDAVEAGRAQAEQLAEVLGVELGDLLVASRQPSYAVYGGQPGGACAEPLTVEQVKEGSIYLPVFNAAVEPEFEIYATVSLTYAIA